ncbi:MAG: hypothetical protein ACI9PU_000106 [Ascidiaceihabitans sp.]|jgi:hypothetical protein
MRVSLPLMLCATIAVTGCARVADSRLNPLNWFGSSTSAPLTAAGELRPLVPANRATRVVDGRGTIQSVTAMAIEKAPNGAIVRATGVASKQGQFNAQLVPVSNEGGILTLAFRIEGVANAATNNAFSRQVTVARVLTFADLAGVRTIRVQSATNQRSASR